MTPPFVSDALELLLAATFSERKDGRKLSFLFGAPGDPAHLFQGGMELSMGKVELLKCALFVRVNGPPYLRNLSIHEIEGKLTSFLTENYGHIAGETWLVHGAGSFAGRVSAASKEKMAAALASSELFSPRIVPTLFPLVTVQVEADYESEPFFLVHPAGLAETQLGKSLRPGELIPTQFPPFAGDMAHRAPNSWLGVQSPSLSTSKKVRNAVLGAVALLPHPRERHLFTGRSVFGGRATYDNGWTISFGESHTPKISEDIKIVIEDHGWLDVLAGKLESPTKEDRRHVKALEYYYRAWSLGEVDRFPVLFQALDAIFGDASQATQAVIAAVGPIMGSAYDYDRLKLLLSLRGSVVHGGAPDVYESSKYFEYYEKYVEDPIHDLELIAASCLSSIIFAGTLVSRPHTYAALLKEKLGVDV